jgi:phospholipid/cholesterol/gamma-HCH transport system permease protein
MVSVGLRGGRRRAVADGGPRPIPMLSGFVGGVVRLGEVATFFLGAFAAIPAAVRHYRKEIARLLSDISWGRALLVGGGIMGVMLLLSAFVGTSVGIAGFTGLNIIGLAPFAGFVSALANTREFAPLIAGTAFAAQVGCRYTAQIGAMRISEEIDALEVMAVRPMPYLVATRMIASMLAMLPLYVVGLFGSYFATKLVVTAFFRQSSGTYEHYFLAFLNPFDIVLSTIKVAIFIVLTTLIHCYYGYYAAGGPEGVGRATGRAIRASIIAIIVTDMFMTLAFWGYDPGVRISG